MTKKSRDPANAVCHGQTLESLGPSYLRRLAEELRGGGYWLGENEEDD